MSDIEERERLERLVSEKTKELGSINEQLKAKIEECMEANKAIKEAETKYKTLVEQSLEGIVIAKGGPLRLVFANPAMSKLTGYTVHELTALSEKELWGLLHPEDREIFFKRFRDRLEGNKPTQHYEFRSGRKDGSVIWLSIFSRRIEYEGEPAVLATFSDITERKEAEEALRENEEKFRALFKNIPEPAYTWRRIGDDFVLIDYNDAAMEVTKGKIAALVGASASELYHDVPEIPDRMRRCYESRDCFECEMLYKFRTTGEDKYLGVKYTFVPPDLVLVHAEDITERKKNEEELKNYRDQLEDLVERRADQLKSVNEKLLKQINERSRAEKELEDRNRELLFLNEIYEIITASESRDEILERVLDPMMRYCDSTVAALYDLDQGKNELVQLKVEGVEDELKERWRIISAGEGIIKELLVSDGVLILEQDLPGIGTPRERLKGQLGIKRTISLLFRSRGDIKTLAFIGCPNGIDITLEQRRVFDIAGKQLGIALERLDLMDALGKRERELRELASGLINSSEQERRRMATTLHDEMSQSLVAINVEFDMLQKRVDPHDTQCVESIRVINEELQRITESSRQISYALHPAILKDLGLVSALQWYTEKYIESGDLKVDIEAVGFDEKLPERTGLALYRIAQEALTNILRHADASAVSIKLTKGYPRVIMVIVDNGKGFEIGRETGARKGLGLVIMRERAGFLGGDFRIQSSTGKGTRIRVTVPLEVNDDNGQ